MKQNLYRTTAVWHRPWIRSAVSLSWERLIGMLRSGKRICDYYTEMKNYCIKKRGQPIFWQNFIDKYGTNGVIVYFRNFLKADMVTQTLYKTWAHLRECDRVPRPVRVRTDQCRIYAFVRIVYGSVRVEFGIGAIATGFCRTWIALEARWVCIRRCWPMKNGRIEAHE